MGITDLRDRLVKDLNDSIHGRVLCAVVAKSKECGHADAEERVRAFLSDEFGLVVEAGQLTELSREVGEFIASRLLAGSDRPGGFGAGLRLAIHSWSVASKTSAMEVRDRFRAPSLASPQFVIVRPRGGPPGRSANGIPVDRDRPALLRCLP